MKVWVSGHGMYKTEYHVVFCTKYRRRILNPGLEGYLRKLFLKVIRQMPGVVINTIGFDTKLKDHVHLEMVIPPKYAISEVIGQIKGWTGSQMRKKFPWLEKVYWKENIIWSEGFFVSSVGVNEEMIKHYILWQGKQDSGQVQLNLKDSANLKTK